MTAEWEKKLLEVEKQDIASEDFMAEIKDMIVDLIETYEPVKGADKLFPHRQYKQYNTVSYSSQISQSSISASI